MEEVRSLRSSSTRATVVAKSSTINRLLATLDELVKGKRAKGNSKPSPESPYPLPYGAKGTSARGLMAKVILVVINEHLTNVRKSFVSQSF